MTMPAWTYSQLGTFETCPKQFYHTKVMRDVVDPETEATIWGTKVHTAFENWLLKGDKLPEGMTQWQGIADKFAALPGEKLVEHKFSIDRNLQPSPWKESWSRGIADLVVRHKTKVMLVDWKTGKRKPTEQLQLYTGYVKAYWPETTEVQTAFVWLKEKKISKDKFTAEQVPIIWQGFMPRVRRLENAYEKDSWPTRPSGLCNGWCPVKTCIHWKPKR